MTFSLIKTLRVSFEYRLPIKAAIIANNRPFYKNFSIYQQELPRTMAPEITLPQIFKFVDQNVESYKKILQEAVAIPSVSCDVKYRGDCIRMVEWMQEKMREIGASSELRDVGFQTIDGKEVKLPPVLVGVLGNVSLQYQLIAL